MTDELRPDVVDRLVRALFARQPELVLVDLRMRSVPTEAEYRAAQEQHAALTPAESERLRLKAENDEYGASAEPA